MYTDALFLMIPKLPFRPKVKPLDMKFVIKLNKSKHTIVLMVNFLLLIFGYAFGFSYVFFRQLSNCVVQLVNISDRAASFQKKKKIKKKTTETDNFFF